MPSLDDELSGIDLLLAQVRKLLRNYFLQSAKFGPFVELYRKFSLDYASVVGGSNREVIDGYVDLEEVFLCLDGLVPVQTVHGSRLLGQVFLGGTGIDGFFVDPLHEYDVVIQEPEVALAEFLLSRSRAVDALHASEAFDLGLQAPQKDELVLRYAALLADLLLQVAKS